MRFVLGIDSGGTKYLVRAAGLDGTPLGAYQGPTCNHYYLSREETIARITDNIGRCLSSFGGTLNDCAYLLCGTTGLDSEEDGEQILALYQSIPALQCPIRCMNDAELAYHAVVGDTGILLIAGTGSIVFGKNPAGKTVRVGGWFSSIMGDEGSGRYIDAWALHHYSRWLDGCRPFTPLARMIRRELGLNSRKELMDCAAQMAAPPWSSPGLGRIVNEAASQGDPYALAILRRAGAWNFKLVEEAVGLLGFGRDETFRVGLWGSTILHGTCQRTEMVRLLKAAYPQVHLCLPSHDAAQEAVLMALDALAEG